LRRRASTAPSTVHMRRRCSPCWARLRRRRH
jgi:hypothetical protein